MITTKTTSQPTREPRRGSVLAKNGSNTAASTSALFSRRIRRAIGQIEQQKAEIFELDHAEP